MSSTPMIGAAVLVFCIAALLYYQSTTVENFASEDVITKNMLNAWATWDPKQPPIAGRQYNPLQSTGFVVPDLNRAPISKPGGYPNGSGFSTGSFPPAADNKPQNVPGPMNTTRQTLAQAKDLSELDSKIMTWLAAASQKEHEKPGSLTSQQQEHRIILQARLEDIRQQLGLNQVTDNYVTVANEIKALRRENANWQHQAPFVSDAFDFGKGVNPDALLTKEYYDRFFGILGAAIKEFHDLYQPDPLQKVRYQQLQIIRQSLIDSSSPTNPPPIRMGAAQLFLRQMLRPEQPLPTLFSVDFIRAGLGNDLGLGLGLDMNSDDVMEYLRNIQWKLTMSYDPADQEMKRAAASLMDRLRSGGISVTDARAYITHMDQYRQPMPFGATISPFVGSQGKPEKPGKPNPIITGAQRLCKQISKAFPNPRDAKALGCSSIISDKDHAEAVINTVCENIRSSVPSITPEQFNCPALKQMTKSDGHHGR